LTNGHWNHIAVTINNLGQITGLFINGTKNVSGKANVIYNNLYVGDGIGTYDSLEYGGFNVKTSGTIVIGYDEIGCFNRELKDDEILRLYELNYE
jgi:hypothetical protein